MSSIKNNTITFDESDFLAGMHPNFSATATTTPIPRGANGKLVFSSAMNPYRYLGYASPGFKATDVTNVSVVTNSAIRQIAIGAESGTYYGYGVNSNSRVFQINSLSGALTNAGSWPHTNAVGGGVIEGESCIFYSINIGGVVKPSIFYSYNNSGAGTWDIGRYDLTAGTFTDAFASVVPATPLVAATDYYPHPMIIGDDDLLYVGVGNVLMALDGATGANGTWDSAALVLPVNFRITSFAKYQHKLAIIGYVERNVTASSNPSAFYQTTA